MMTRLAALTTAAILLTGPAFAVSTTTTTKSVAQCNDFLAFTQKLVEGDSDVGERALAEINALLEKMRSQCNESKFEEADETAALIRGMNATE